MEVFLMVRREKTTIFLEANEDTTVLQVKVMLEPIVKRSPDDQRLCRHDTKEVLDEKKSLGDSGFKMQSCKAMDPGCIDLMFRVDENQFDDVSTVAYSNPPELPEVMKAQESSAVPSGLTSD